MHINTNSKYYAKYASKNITWDSPVEKYKEYDTIPYRPEGSKLPETHVENMDKSVRWNQQFIKDHNDAWDKARKALDRKRSTIIAEAHGMIKYLMGEELDWKLSDGDLERYFSHWYERYHSDGFAYMCDMIQSNLSDIMDMDWFKNMRKENSNGM